MFRSFKLVCLIVLSSLMWEVCDPSSTFVRTSPFTEGRHILKAAKHTLVHALMQDRRGHDHKRHQPLVLDEVATHLCLVACDYSFETLELAHIWWEQDQIPPASFARPPPILPPIAS